MPADGVGHHAVLNYIYINNDGSLRWNGSEISPQKLDENLRILQTLNPMPTTLLRVEPDAPCNVVSRTRKRMEQALECEASGMCGEGMGEFEPRMFAADPRTPEYKSAADEADRALEDAKRRKLRD